MEEKEIKKSVMETCKEYYEHLNRDGINNISPEKGKEIFEVADTYRGMHEHKDYYKTVDLRFESAVQKLISAKDNVVSLTSYVLVEDGELLKNQIVSRDIKLETDAEKILFIIRSIDPENKLFQTWTDIAQKLTTDTNSFLMSASNYGKARKIMSEYHNGFFNIKLIIDEQAYLIYKNKLIEENLENTLKK